VHIIDLGSTRGTLVNGERISKARLQSGDEIMFGDSRVIVTFLEAQQGQVTPPLQAARGGRVPGAYAPPPQQAYAPPPQQAYVPPPQQAYAPPQQAYAPPAGGGFSAGAGAEVEVHDGSR